MNPASTREKDVKEKFLNGFAIIIKQFWTKEDRIPLINEISYPFALKMNKWKPSYYRKTDMGGRLRGYEDNEGVVGLQGRHSTCSSRVPIPGYTPLAEFLDPARTPVPSTGSILNDTN